ncbi:MAG: RNA polymerase sigma factor [Vicinamibacterales bacterium]
MDPFRELYERYYRDVYRFALFLTGDAARAEDLTADTFVRAWTARDRIRQETVRAYLLTIARNLYRDSLRAARPYAPLDARLADRAPGIDVQVEQASTLRQVCARMRKVARGDRRALLLYVIREMSRSSSARAAVRRRGRFFPRLPSLTRLRRSSRWRSICCAEFPSAECRSFSRRCLVRSPSGRRSDGSLPEYGPCDEASYLQSPVSAFHDRTSMTAWLYAGSRAGFEIGS